MKTERNEATNTTVRDVLRKWDQWPVSHHIGGEVYKLTPMGVVRRVGDDLMHPLTIDAAR